MRKIIIAFIIGLVLSIPCFKVSAEEVDEKVVELCSFDINGFYTQDGDSSAVVYQESNGNQYIKLAYKDSNYSTFYFEIDRFINKDGMYKLEMDVRYDDHFQTNNIFMQLFGSGELLSNTLAGDKAALEKLVTDSEVEGWKKLSYTFNVTSAYSYECFKFGFNTMGAADNYLDIDNIKFYYCSPMVFDEVNIDTETNGDFEGFSGAYEFDKTGWHADNTFYLSNAGLDNSVLVEENNKVLKLYTESGKSTSITKKLNTSIAEEGWYQLSFKAKAGKNFYTNNLGFRVNNDVGLNGHVGETAISYSDINQYSWTTINTPFEVKKTSSSTWFNLDLWLFTHNNDSKRKSENNYLLIDDIVISKYVSGGEYGQNLFEAGELSGFSAAQGKQKFTISKDEIVAEYPYYKDILTTDVLEQFAVGKKFASNSKEQLYWGTTSYDVPAVIVEEDGYHAALISYDGKQVTKTFSSLSYLLDLVELSTKKYYIFEFDYKLESVDTDVCRVAFIGSNNLDDYMMNLLEVEEDGTYYTQGVNKREYSFEVVTKEDGWRHVTLIFQPNIDFKGRVNAVRFLLNANFNEDNKFYVANIGLKEISKTEYKVYEDTTPEVEEPVANDGCGGALVTSILGTVILTGGILVLRSKKGKGDSDEE